MKKRKNFQPRVFITALIVLLEILLIIGFFVCLIILPLGEYYAALPIIFLLIFDIVLSLFIANTRVEADFKISWLVIIIVFPIAGGVLYLLFANKMTTRRMKKKRINIIDKLMISQRPNSIKELNELKNENEDASKIADYLYLSAYSGCYKNTEVSYYKIGDLSLKPMVEELKKAKKFIFLEYFIMQSGHFFDSIFDVLKEKAKEGVDVRIIYDDFGCSSKMSSYFYLEVRKAGIKCYPFNFIRPFVDIRQNNRDHRKIMVIDGVTGFTGGINLADEYINIGSKFGLWKDNCVMLKGPAVNGLTNLFLSIWNLLDNRTKKKDILKDFSIYSYDFNKAFDLRESKISEGFVVPFGDEPFDGEEVGRNVFLGMINRANKYIYITTPYLILDEELICALRLASKSGVDVKIITPGTPDKKIVYQCTRSNYGPLLLDGVKIYEYQPGFNHEKMIVVDGIMAETGTFNFDFRSLYLHYENGIFFYGVKEINEMTKDLEEMLKDSKAVETNKYLNISKFKRIYWSILRIISTLF